MSILHSISYTYVGHALPPRAFFPTSRSTTRSIMANLLHDSFPDIAYFRDAEVQAELTHILYLYSDMHPDIGYRQGMHELLAPLYYAVDYDSVSEDSNTDPTLKEFCSRSWTAADAWCLFSAVMKGASRWYEWQEKKIPAVTEPTPLPSHVQVNMAVRDNPMKPYIAPIVESANRVQSVLLKGVDPELWKALQTAGIEPQIYGMYACNSPMSSKPRLIILLVGGYVYSLRAN